MTRHKDVTPPPAVYILRAPLRAPRFTFAAAALSLLLGLSSLLAASPYQPIVERNVFGLKPPPPPPDPETLKPPPSKLTLTGIMTIFGKRQALLKAPPSPAPPGKPGHPAEPPREHSYLLAEGQAEDGITILQIDTVAKTVKLDNAGHIETLTFSTNAPTATAGPSGAPSAPGFQNGMPQPNFPRTIPRPLRIPTAGSSTSIPYGGVSGNSASGAEGYGVGSGTAANGVGQQQTSAGPRRSLEENVALAEVNALQNEQQRAAGMRVPPIPHHPLAAGMYGDSAETPVQAPAPPLLRRPGMPQMPQ